MNIKNCEHASGVIANWIGTYANQYGKKTLIVGLTDNIPSTIAALLCSKVGEYTTKSIMEVMPKTICVHMTEDPHSSKAQRLTEFTQSHGLALEVLPRLSVSVYEGKDRILPLSGSGIDNHVSYEKSLRAMVLAHFADVHDGLVVGTVTATRGVMQRSHCKYGDGAADIFPLLDLHDSEVRELAQHWNFEASSSIFPPPTEEDQVEWAQRENERRLAAKGRGIFGGIRQPQQHPLWYKYTAPQKQVISELWARERKTRHKSLLDKPYCQLRQIEGLFSQ